MDTGQLIGMSEEDAVALIRVEGLIPRVTRRDTEYIIVTMEFLSNRINLQIENGKVVFADVG